MTAQVTDGASVFFFSIKIKHFGHMQKKNMHDKINMEK